MKHWVSVVLIVGAVLAAIHNAQAHVVIHVDKSSQRMTVSVDGERRYSFVVSTARAGYSTPNGSYRRFKPAPAPVFTLIPVGDRPVSGAFVG